VEVAAVDADDDPVRWREASVELEFPLHVLILAVGHQSLPQCRTRHPVLELYAEKAPRSEIHEEAGADESEYRGELRSGSLLCFGSNAERRRRQ
jgi:hypothetical protein